MKNFCLLGFLVPILMYSQTPSFTLGTNSKYFDFRKSWVSDDFKQVSQIRIGSYLTLGNFGLSNSSWIGSNAILDYSSYGSIGSLGNKNLFIPEWNSGTALVMQLDFVTGTLRGYNHQWNGNSAQVDFLDFEQVWEFGKTRSYFLSSLGIGTASTGSYKLAVKGKIRAEEIKVETGWADYVFKEGYDLPTLEEVERHIKEKGHLINIPSSAEVEKNGVELGEMNKLLLEKIEELTLYIIDLKKGQTILEKQNKDLFNQLKNLNQE